MHAHWHTKNMYIYKIVPVAQLGGLAEEVRHADITTQNHALGMLSRDLRGAA